MQITTNVITPGVEVAVTVAYPNGESWGGVLRNTKAPRHGRYPRVRRAFLVPRVRGARRGMPRGRRDPAARGRTGRTSR